MKILMQTLIPLGCLLAASAVSAAQKPAPAPAPAPVAAPAKPPIAPFGSSGDWTEAKAFEAMERAQEMASRVQDLVNEKAVTAVQDRMLDVQRRLEEAQMVAQSAGYGTFQQPFGMGRQTSADSLYERGQNALDRRRWDEALTDFTQAASRGGNRGDGALYWKAYTLNKLGRRDEAVAALAELRKSYPSSRWLDDAKALEMEVKQASGQPVSPESQTDEDLKLMALNGLMQSDPDRSIPTLEGLLKSAQSPRLKERALFVLAQSSLPKAQQVVEQVARGAGNPDLQVKAIQYLAQTRRRNADGQQQAANGQLFSEVYSSSNDATVKRAILDALVMNRDSDRLLQVVKTEKTPELRADAVRRLSSIRSANTADALAGTYGGEQDKNVKRAIIDSLYSQNNVKAMVVCARSEKDPEMVRFIVSRIASMKSPEAVDYLMEILKK